MNPTTTIPTPPETAPSPSPVTTEERIPSQPPPTLPASSQVPLPPHALFPKEGSRKGGFHGKRSPFDDMDPRLAKTIDNELLSGLCSLSTLSRKYSLTIHQLRWRQRTLHQSIGKGKAGELAGRAGEAMDWASERTKEVYTIAAEKKTPILDANGTPLMVTIEQMGKEVQIAMETETPDLPTMLEAVKQMHALARSFGEFEHRIGKIAELKAQKELGIGIGPQQGMGGWGGVGQLNVLVMPKEAGVEDGGRMPKFQLPPALELQNQSNSADMVVNPDPAGEDLPSGDPDEE